MEIFLRYFRNRRRRFCRRCETYKVIGHIQVHPRPRSVAFLPDGSRAFVPSESAGELNVVDTANQKLLKVIALPKGSRPMTVKVSPAGKIFYASTGRAGTVCVLDANTYEVLNTIKVGTRPWGIVISPDAQYLSAISSLFHEEGRVRRRCNQTSGLACR